MARKELSMTRDLRYGTRMLQAGEPVELDGPKARLFEALGWAGPTARIKTAKAPVQKPDALDHDGDGRKGGSTKGATSTRRKGKARKAKAAK